MPLPAEHVVGGTQECIGSGIAKGFGYNKHLWFMIFLALLQCGALMGVSETSHHTQPLTGMLPAFHIVSGHWYPIILDLSLLAFFSSYKKCPFFSLPCQQGK